MKPRFLKSMFDIKTLDDKNKPARYLVSGYTFEFNGYKFGIHKNPAGWTLTDLRTGMKVTGRDTRKEAVEWLERYFDVYQRTTMQPYYADLTHEFSNLPTWHTVKIKL